MSPGNLYRYFPSKEALIAGIAERDRAEVAQEFASADLSQGFFAVLEGMALPPFLRAAGRAGEALHRDHVGGAPPSGDRAHLGRVRRRREEMADRPACAPAPIAATFARDLDFDAVGDHADDHRRRRLVAPRARSRISMPRRCCRSSWISRVTCWVAAPAKRVRAKERCCDESKPHRRGRPGRRRGALDRVRAFPAARERGTAKPSVRSDAAAKKPFRVAVMRGEGGRSRPQARALRPHRGRPARDRRPRARAACSPNCACAAARGWRRATSSPCSPTMRARRRWRRRNRW